MVFLELWTCGITDQTLPIVLHKFALFNWCMSIGMEGIYVFFITCGYLCYFMCHPSSFVNCPNLIFFFVVLCVLCWLKYFMWFLCSVHAWFISIICLVHYTSFVPCQQEKIFVSYGNIKNWGTKAHKDNFIPLANGLGSETTELFNLWCGLVSSVICSLG